MTLAKLADGPCHGTQVRADLPDEITVGGTTYRRTRGQTSYRHAPQRDRHPGYYIIAGQNLSVPSPPAGPYGSREHAELALEQFVLRDGRRNRTCDDCFVRGPFPTHSLALDDSVAGGWMHGWPVGQELRDAENRRAR